MKERRSETSVSVTSAVHDQGVMGSNSGWVKLVSQSPCEFNSVLPRDLNHVGVHFFFMSLIAQCLR